MAKTKKFLIIDANSLIHRAYHALPPLTTRDGRLVNAVYGFANIYLKVLREHKPDYVAVCFDVAGGTFRDVIYADYKAGREKKPQEFYNQFDIIKNLLNTFNTKVYELQGYEADDLIGTLASEKRETKNEKIRKIILTGDKDMLQLVDRETEVEIVKKGVSETLVYTPKTVRDDFGFAAYQLIDYKALRGDPSDNIPGVLGVGEKTATDLIRRFGSIEKLYDYVDTIKASASAKTSAGKQSLKLEIREGVLFKLIEHKKDAYLSKKLVTIKTDVPLKFKLDEVEVKSIDYDKAVAIIQDLGFKSLLNRLPKPETGTLFKANNKHLATKGQTKAIHNERTKRTSRKSYTLIDSENKFKKFITELEKQTIFAFDTETDQLGVVGAKLVGMSFSWHKNTGFYIPATNLKTKELKSLKNVLENPKIKKTGHNIKYDYQVLKQTGINLAGIEFDSMIASYLLSPGSRSHSLDDLAFSEFGVKMIPIEEMIGKGKDQKSMADIPVAQVAEYAAEDADITWRLYEKFSINKDLKLLNKVFAGIEMPLVTILGDMELIGIKLDTRLLKNLSQKLGRRIKTLETNIYKLAGVKFNVASPVQLKEILFDKLKLPTKGLSKIKTGVSTSAQDLIKLKGLHKIIELIMEFRELSKLKNTYTDALPELVNKTTGRVHTSFNQTVAATGRLSSTHPNLQNIPIRTDLGEKIRHAFVAQKGFTLISADYSQFELRIVASLSNDKKMIQAFKTGQDIHTRTAADVYDIPLAKVTRQQRREAKEVNFGIIYGLGRRGLAQRAGISYEKSKDFFERYAKLHPQLKNYLMGVVETTRSLGYSETMFGRRRYFPEINSGHPMMRAAAERAAVNLPIQGSQADLIKIAMINIDKKLKSLKLKKDVKMLLQVHDELLFEVKEPKAKNAIKLIKNTMEGVITLKVPIEVDVGIGKNWGETG